MKILRGTSLLLVIASLWAAPAIHAENTAALNEVTKLKLAGMTDETVIAYVQSKNINYDMSADSILRLSGQGFSTAVLNALLASGKSGATSSSAAYTSTAAPSIVASTPAPAAVVAATPAVAAPTSSPDVAYFYQELSSDGKWILTENGLYAWQPTVAVSVSSWRPYWDNGHWIWTDEGWYWSSDYSWGWAAFHYGRWNLHPRLGWIWYPDRVWGPSWVVWREGGGYRGWAPLPPGAIFDTVSGRFTFHGRAVVDAGFGFDLGAVHFNFCLSTEILDTRHRRADRDPSAIFGKTAFVNKYTVSRPGPGGDDRVRIINRGIEPPRSSAGRGKPVEPVHIKELKSPASDRSHERLDSKKQTIEVYRPRLGDSGPSSGPSSSPSPGRGSGPGSGPRGGPGGDPR
jgi:hypothetical protein